MRKNLFYTVMMMAVMAVVTISFTACGGGDDDPLTDNNQNKQDPDDISVYIWPCMQWGCSLSDIKTYMASSSMVITEEREGILIYQTTDRKYVIGYGLDNNSYINFQAVFTGYSQKKMNNIKDKFKKDYGLSFEDNGYGEVWRAVGTINGKNCEVKIWRVQSPSSIIVDVFILN